MFSTLYISAIHLGSLLFEFIDHAFPGVSIPYERPWASWGIRFATSGLIVAFPVFLFSASRIAKEISIEPARRNSAVRRWLTYLTLFIAAMVIVGDLITLVFNLLSGELTVRFVLKVIVVAAIAGGIFSYYLWSSKADDEALGR